MCMNDGKTHYLPIAPKSAAALVDGSVVRVGVSTITASRCVRNLGIFIDRHLYMKKEVSQTVSACSFYLRHINQISRFLPKPTKERVVNAIITSRLDYCNAVLYGSASVVNIACLQRIHNSAAKLILRRPRSDSARPLLQELTGCPWHAESISKYWYLHTKLCTTKRQCICENSCAHINRQEHCALPAVTIWK